MISAFFGRELCTRLTLDEVTEGGLLSLELSGLVLGIYPVEDILLLVFSLPCHQYAAFGEVRFSGLTAILRMQIRVGVKCVLISCVRLSKENMRSRQE